MADAFDTMNQKAISGVPMEYRPRGLTDVKKQVSSIKGMLVLSTLALVVLTALNLGMVVAGVYITRQFTLTTGPDGVEHLAKRGSNKIIHVGQSAHENLPLDSRASDDYFKKLDSVTMNFDIPQPMAQPTTTPTPVPQAENHDEEQDKEQEEDASKPPLLMLVGGARRKLESLNRVRHTIHAKVNGFQRVACPDCASGTQVKLNTHLGNFVVKDQAVIPILDEKHFPGLDMKAFRESAAIGQGIPKARIDAWNQKMMQDAHKFEKSFENESLLFSGKTFGFLDALRSDQEMLDQEMPDMPVPEDNVEDEVASSIPTDISREGLVVEDFAADMESTTVKEEESLSSRRSLNGVFSGVNHGSWDAGFHDSITGTKNHVTFDSHYDNNWSASGGSKTDIGASFHYDMNSRTGEASAGISHSWRN